MAWAAKAWLYNSKANKQTINSSTTDWITTKSALTLS